MEYIKKKEESYLDGKYFDPEELMQLALNNYTIRMESGKWRVGMGASIEQEQLNFLSSKVNLDFPMELEKRKRVTLTKKRIRGKERPGIRKAMTTRYKKGTIYRR